jgi:hypothetical protein
MGSAANIDKYCRPAQTASQGPTFSPLRNPSKHWYTGKEIITAETSHVLTLAYHILKDIGYNDQFRKCN